MIDNGYDNILGVTLCGGMSSRMGKDKGLIPLGESTWSKKTVSILQNAGLKTVLSINPLQYPYYKKIFPDEMLIIDSIKVSGPLKGILSVQNNYPNFNLIILACDMINMTSYYIKNLIELSFQHSNYSFILYQNGNRIEPLCGFYSNNGLRYILKKVLNNEITNYSLYKLLDHEKRLLIPIQKNDENYFKNFNSPDDLESKIK